MKKTLLVTLMAASLCYSEEAKFVVEEDTKQIELGIFTGSNGGLRADSGRKFFGYAQKGGMRRGVVYAPFSSLGLGESIQPGKYVLVMRVAKNDRSGWPGAKNLIDFDSNQPGFAGGFFRFDPRANYAMKSMAEFNAKRGVKYNPPHGEAASPGADLNENEWYSVTSSWTVDEDSSVVGMDLNVGVGFQINDEGSVWLDDCTLSFEPLD